MFPYGNNNRKKIKSGIQTHAECTNSWNAYLLSFQGSKPKVLITCDQTTFFFRQKKPNFFPPSPVRQKRAPDYRSFSKLRSQSMELHIPGPKAFFFLLQFAQNATIKFFFSLTKCIILLCAVTTVPRIFFFLLTMAHLEGEIFWKVPKKCYRKRPKTLDEGKSAGASCEADVSSICYACVVTLWWRANDNKIKTGWHSSEVFYFWKTFFRSVSLLKNVGQFLFEWQPLITERHKHR